MTTTTKIPSMTIPMNKREMRRGYVLAPEPPRRPPSAQTEPPDTQQTHEVNNATDVTFLETFTSEKGVSVGGSA